MQRARDCVKSAPATKRKRATAPDPTGLDRNATKKVLQERIISRGQDAMSNDKTSLSLESLDKVVGGTGGSVPDLDHSGKAIDAITASADEKQPTGGGNKILESMHSMRGGMKEAVEDIEKTLASSAMSPADMLRAQMKLSQVTMQQDLAGKVVSTTEHNLDTLMKGQ
jgi:type III secretion system YscI/HrpB-like protein